MVNMKPVLCILIFCSMVFTPAHALQARLNLLLSGCVGVGVGAVHPLDPHSDLEAGVMLPAFDPNLPLLFEAHYQRYLSDEREDQPFVQIGFQRISADYKLLDFVKFGGGWRNPFKLSERLETTLFGGYFLEQKRIGLVGINLSYLL